MPRRKIEGWSWRVSVGVELRGEKEGRTHV